MTIRTLVVDDHQLMREAVCALLAKSREVEVVGQAADGRIAVEMAMNLQPDIIIMDVKMPNVDGLDATRQIMENHSNLKIIGFSAYAETGLVEEMFRAGAKGYMLKESGFTVMKEAIAAVLSGRTFLCSQLCMKVESQTVVRLS